MRRGKKLNQAIRKWRGRLPKVAPSGAALLAGRQVPSKSKVDGRRGRRMQQNVEGRWSIVERLEEGRWGVESLWKGLIQFGFATTAPTNTTNRSSFLLAIDFSPSTFDPRSLALAFSFQLSSFKFLSCFTPPLLHADSSSTNKTEGRDRSRPCFPAAAGTRNCGACLASTDRAL